MAPGIDTFFATETIPYQDGAVFKGNLRGEPEETHNRLTESLKSCVGDKYRLFLVENADSRPVVIVLPSRNDLKNLRHQKIKYVELQRSLARSVSFDNFKKTDTLTI